MDSCRLLGALWDHRPFPNTLDLPPQEMQTHPKILSKRATEGSALRLGCRVEGRSSVEPTQGRILKTKRNTNSTLRREANLKFSE